MIDRDLNEWSYKMDDILCSLQGMQHRESKYQPSQNYVAQHEAVVPIVSSSSSKVNMECRDILCSWCFRVVDHFRKPRHVVASAMSFLDRFSSKHADCARGTYQLVAITSLYLALKLEEGGRIRDSDYRSQHDLCYRDVLAHLTNDGITFKHILKMEIVLLQTFGFYTNPPLITTFVVDYIELLPLMGHPDLFFVEEQHKEALVNKANSFTDMAVLDGSLSTARPSLVALACTLNAIRQEELHKFDEDVATGGSILLTPVLIGIKTHIRSISKESTACSFFQNVLQDSVIFNSKKDMELVSQIQETLWQAHAFQQGVCLDSPVVDVPPSCIVLFPYCHAVTIQGVCLRLAWQHSLEKQVPNHI
jgi:hypothetical protein